jgi:hypothetical protein
MKNKPSSDIRSVRRKPREEWPASFQVHWDFSPENIYLAVDGGAPEDYTSDKYSFGEADLAEIDEKLHGSSRRSASELWGVVDNKVAKAILHWSNGLAMTPPLLEVNMGCLVIVGGNNRMAVCRADFQQRLPFLYLRVQTNLFAAKLSSFRQIS